MSNIETYNNLGGSIKSASLSKAGLEGIENDLQGLAETSELGRSNLRAMELTGHPMQGDVTYGTEYNAEAHHHHELNKKKSM